MPRRVPAKLEAKKAAGAPAPAPTTQMDLENKPARLPVVPIHHDEVTVTKHAFSNTYGKVSVTMDELRRKVRKTSKKTMTMEELVMEKLRLSKPKGMTGLDVEQLWKQFAKEIETEMPEPVPAEEPVDEEEDEAPAGG
jgi:hypothetical protein